MIFGTRVQNHDMSRDFIFIFDIFMFSTVRQVKGQNIVQDDKIIMCCTLYLTNHTSYDID